MTGMDVHGATEQAYKNGFEDGKNAVEVSNHNRISRISTINRALGMIEGVSCGVDTAIADTLLAAVEMIDTAVGELLADG